MHNGILYSKEARAKAVDSFALSALPDNSEDALLSLMTSSEAYANVFRIYPNQSKYQMLRLLNGTLYTDGAGNYSSNILTSISVVVPPYTEANHVIEGRVGMRPSPIATWWRGTYMDDDYDDLPTRHSRYPNNHRRLGTGNYNHSPNRGLSRDVKNALGKDVLGMKNNFSDNWDEPTDEELDKIDSEQDEIYSRQDRIDSEDEGLSPSDALAAARSAWEMEEGDEFILANSQVFVVLNTVTRYLHIYGMEDGVPVYKERCYGDHNEELDMDAVKWQAQLMLDDMLVAVRGQ